MNGSRRGRDGTRALTLVMLCCGLSLQAVIADPGPVTPQLTVLPARTKTDPGIWAVGGSRCPVALQLTAPPGSTAQLRCELVQVAEGLAAPLNGGGELASGLSFSGRSHLDLEVSIPLPIVERETKLVARISMILEGGGAPVTQNLHIHVVPAADNPLNPITRLRRLPEGTLGVTGESPRLRAFLDRVKIPYIDGAAGASLVLCEGSELPEGFPRGTPAILFSEAGRRLPGVYADSRSGAGCIKVTLPLLDELASGVLAQITFADLICSALPAQQNKEP